jgi:hypothetical protein
MFQFEKDTHHPEKQQLACVYTAVNALLKLNQKTFVSVGRSKTPLHHDTKSCRNSSAAPGHPLLEFRPANQQKCSVATTAQLLHSNMATCTERA